MDKNVNKYLKILTPSWLSGFVCIAFSVLVSLGTVVMIHLNNLGLTDTIFSVTVGSNSSYHTIASNLSKYPAINYLPLYLFWGGVGAIVYFLAVRTYKVFTDIISLESRLNYVNARRREMVRQMLLHLLIRLLALVVWIVFINFTLQQVLPYCLLQLHNLADQLSLHSILVLFYTSGLLALTMAVHVIILRFLFLKTRLFGEPI